MCTLLSPAFILCASGALRLVQSIPSMCNKLGKWLERQVKKKVQRAGGNSMEVPVWVQAGLPSNTKLSGETMELTLLHKQRDEHTAWIPSVAYWLKTVAGATSSEAIGTNVQTLYVAAFTFGGLSYTRTLLQAFDCTKNNDKLWYLDSEASTPCMQHHNPDGTYSLSYDSFWACLLTVFLTITFLAGVQGVRRISRGKEFVHKRTNKEPSSEPEFCDDEPLTWPTEYISLGWLRFAWRLVVWMKHWHEIFSTVFVLLTLKCSGVWWMYEDDSIGICIGTIVICCWACIVAFILAPLMATFSLIGAGFAAALSWLVVVLVMSQLPVVTARYQRQRRCHSKCTESLTSAKQLGINDTSLLGSSSDEEVEPVPPQALASVQVAQEAAAAPSYQNGRKACGLVNDIPSKVWIHFKSHLQQEKEDTKSVLWVTAWTVCLIALLVNYRLGGWFGAGWLIVWLIGWARLQSDRSRCLKHVASFIHRWQVKLEAKGGKENGTWKHGRLILKWGTRQVKVPSTEGWQWWLFVSTLYLVYWALPAYLWYSYILPTVPPKPSSLEEHTKKHERIVLLASLGLTMYGIGLVRYWIELQRQGNKHTTNIFLCTLWQHQHGRSFAGPAFEFLLDKMKGGWAWWQMVILFRKTLVMICAMMFDDNAVLGWCVAIPHKPTSAET